MAITYYTLSEAASRIGVSVGTLKRAAWRKALKGARKCATGGVARWEVPGPTVSALEQMGPKNVLAALSAKSASSAGKALTAMPAAPVKPAKKAPPAKKPAASKGNQHIVLVMDDSGSMGHLREKANEKSQEMLNSMFGDMSGAGFDVDVSGWVFGSSVARQAARLKSPHAPRITAQQDSTRLNDALIEAIQDCRRTERPDESVLLIVVTDGFDNDGSGTAGDSRREVAAAMATDRYTIVVAGPRDVRRWADRCGIPEGNVTTWDQTNEGVSKLAAQVKQCNATHTTLRSAGQRSTKNFFTTDLSGVSEKDLRALTDVSNRFKSWTVAKEARVDEFIEEKTRSGYVIGSAYYQLMKTETIQPQKRILIQKKGTTRLFGGAEARRLLRLPNSEIRVNPGNHSDYDVFVQSTSVNRKLPRGTKVFWDKTHTTNLTPTWDHTAVPV